MIKSGLCRFNSGGDFLDRSLELGTRDHRPMLDLSGGARLAKDCVDKSSKSWAIRPSFARFDSVDARLGLGLWRCACSVAGEDDLNRGDRTLIQIRGAFEFPIRVRVLGLSRS